MNEPDVDILLVEDSVDDAELALHALRKEKLANSIFIARDGEEALDFVFCRGTFPGRSFDHPALQGPQESAATRPPTVGVPGVNRRRPLPRACFPGQSVSKGNAHRADRCAARHRCLRLGCDHRDAGIAVEAAQLPRLARALRRARADCDPR